MTDRERINKAYEILKSSSKGAIYSISESKHFITIPLNSLGKTLYILNDKNYESTDK